MKTKISSLLFLLLFTVSFAFAGNHSSAFRSPSAESQVVPAAKATGRGVYRGSKYIGKKTWRGSRWVGKKTWRGGRWVAVKTARGVKWVFVGNGRSRRP